MEHTLWNTIIPRPRRVTPRSGAFEVPRILRVWCEDERARSAAAAAFAAVRRITGARSWTDERLPRRWRFVEERDTAEVVLASGGGTRSAPAADFETTSGATSGAGSTFGRSAVSSGGSTSGATSGAGSTFGRSAPSSGDPASGAIPRSGSTSGAYTMQVDPQRIVISGDGRPGVAGGLATLVQALLHLQAESRTPLRLPAATIEDEPYHPWRGFMFDTARHFFPITSLYDTLDLLWLLRFNRFQLHLTDDQGWRLPVDDYPRLTEVGAFRSDATSDGGSYGGYYTHQELRELDAAAAALGITVVPEIDLPGHSSAALTAYPELGCTGLAPGVETRWGIFDAVLHPAGEATQRFIESVFGVAASLFSGEYIHIGGDEVVTTAWHDCPSCRDYVRRHGLTSPDSLYQVIVQAMAESVLALRKRPVAWDEASQLELPRETIIINWRTPEFANAALERGYDIVLAPQAQRAYLDHKHRDDSREPGRLGVCTVRDSASFEPHRYIADALSDHAPVDETGHDPSVGAGSAAAGVSAGTTTRGRILGGQANLWSEGIAFHRQAEYMATIRLAAIAEGLWSGTAGAASRHDNFETRLHELRRLLFDLGYNVYPGPFSQDSVSAH